MGEGGGSRANPSPMVLASLSDDIESRVHLQGFYKQSVQNSICSIQYKPRQYLVIHLAASQTRLEFEGLKIWLCIILGGKLGLRKELLNPIKGITVVKIRFFRTQVFSSFISALAT